MKLSVVTVVPHSGMVVGIDQQGTLIGWKLCTSGIDLQTLRSDVHTGNPAESIKPIYVKREVVPPNASCMLLVNNEEMWIITCTNEDSRWQTCDPNTGSIARVFDNLTTSVSEAFILDDQHLMTVSHKNSIVSLFNKITGATVHLNFDELVSQTFGSPNALSQLSTRMHRIRNGLVFVMKDGIALWNIRENIKTNITLHIVDTNASKIATSADGRILAHDCKGMTHFIDTCASKVVGSFQISCRMVDDISLTSDGKYLVYLSDHRDVWLVRVADQTLPAEYNMYGNVIGFDLSTNDWFVCLNMSDRRLYVLLIADPNDDSHKERIKYVRETIPKLSKQSIKALSMIQSEYGGTYTDGDTDTDVDSWSGADSELDMDDGRQSQMKRRTTTTMSRFQRSKSSMSKRQATVLSLMAETPVCPEDLEGSVVHSTHICSLQ